MFERIRNDIKVIFERDPAARSVLEIFLCYPGFHAVRFHHLAHWLWTKDLRVLARFLSRPMQGVEEIVFAARALNPTDGHWYANFGYYGPDRNRKAPAFLDLEQFAFAHSLNSARGNAKKIEFAMID